MNALLYPGSSSQARQQMPNIRLVDLSPVERAEEQGRARSHSLRPHFRPSGDKSTRSRIHADNAPLPALPVLDDHRPRFEVNVLWAQREGLPETQPATPQNRDQRRITDAARSTP
jgi:hypothetical protein